MTTSIQRRISIVIPCLNDAVLLEQCLSSIVAQTLQPEEVIVVDNGSTDNSVEVANRMGARVFMSHFKASLGLVQLDIILRVET